MSKATSDQASALFDQLIQTDTPLADTSLPGSAENDTLESDDIADDAHDHNSTISGRLVPEAKRAMIRLMRQGVITAKTSSTVFDTLCRHESLIQNHLADMYLKMMLDPQAGFALLQEQETGDLENEEDEPASLISRRSLTLYDTLLLLVLRKYYQERESSGEQQVFIDTDQIESLLTPFLPLTNSSRSDKRNLGGALEKMKERKIIAGPKDSERIEITPVIRYVVNADFLQEMLGSYLTMAGQTNEPVNNKNAVLQPTQQDVDHD